MQIRYRINSITLVESFNHNFAFFSIILVATFKLTCLVVSQQNYDAVKNTGTRSPSSLLADIDFKHRLEPVTIGGMK